VLLDSNSFLIYFHKCILLSMNKKKGPFLIFFSLCNLKYNSCLNYYMPHIESVGIVLYYEDEFLLLRYISGHWGFAKGKPELNEKPLDTARREVKEETGIEGVYVANNFLEKEEYFFKRNGQTVHKEVNYFLGQAPNKVVNISKEHIDHKWLKYEEAMGLITFKETKNVLKEAHDFLVEHGQL
jgi:bis(5'-nucleosidyl)-tetraphosphatase